MQEGKNTQNEKHNVQVIHKTEQCTSSNNLVSWIPSIRDHSRKTPLGFKKGMHKAQMMCNIGSGMWAEGASHVT